MSRTFDESSSPRSEPLVPIQICSDLHLETWQGTSWRRGDVWKSLIVPSAPYLAMVGDISVPGLLTNRDATGPDNFIEFLRWLAQRFVRVFLVLGNHELFTLSKRYDGEPGFSVDTIIEQISDICKSLPGIELLHRRSVVIEEDIRIIGATLWTDIELKNQPLVSLVQSSISDYHRIMVDCRSSGSQRPLTVSDTVEWHHLDRAFIKHEIQQAEMLGQRCLILTRIRSITFQCSYFDIWLDHSPVALETCNPEHSNSILNCAFATDLINELLTMKGVHTWVYGHTHWNARLRIQNTNLLSNQLGYKKPNSDSNGESCGIPYDPEFITYI